MLSKQKIQLVLIGFFKNSLYSFYYCCWGVVCEKKLFFILVMLAIAVSAMWLSLIPGLTVVYLQA